MTRHKKIAELVEAGWLRRQRRPKEPTFWKDPLGYVVGLLRVDEAYDLLVRRRKNGIGR